MANVTNFIDDILVHTRTWEEHLDILDGLFHSLKTAGLTVRPTKCFIGYKKLEYLGHMVGQGLLEPLSDKVTKIQNAPRPKTKKQLRSFLGLTGYYRRKCMCHRSQIQQPNQTSYTETFSRFKVQRWALRWHHHTLICLCLTLKTDCYLLTPPSSNMVDIYLLKIYSAFGVVAKIA